MFLTIISLTVLFVSENEIEDIGKIFYNTNSTMVYVMCVIVFFLHTLRLLTSGLTLSRPYSVVI